MGLTYEVSPHKPRRPRVQKYVACRLARQGFHWIPGSSSLRRNGKRPLTFKNMMEEVREYEVPRLRAFLYRPLPLFEMLTRKA